MNLDNEVEYLKGELSQKGKLGLKQFSVTLTLDVNIIAKNREEAVTTIHQTVKNTVNSSLAVEDWSYGVLRKLKEF